MFLHSSRTTLCRREYLMLYVDVSVFTWCYAAIFAMGPLIGWGHYRREAYGTWCSIDWEEPTFSTNVYIIIIFISTYFFPLSVIIMCYAVIYKKVREVSIHIHILFPTIWHHHIKLKKLKLLQMNLEQTTRKMQF